MFSFYVSKHRPQPNIGPSAKTDENDSFKKVSAKRANKIRNFAAQSIHATDVNNNVYTPFGPKKLNKHCADNVSFQDINIKKPSLLL